MAGLAVSLRLSKISSGVRASEIPLGRPVTWQANFKPPGICGHGLPLGVGSLLDLSLAGCALEFGWRMAGVFPLDSASRRQ